MIARCLDCNSTLTKEEKECFTCGASVIRKDASRVVFGKRFAAFLKYAFILSGILTVASLFFDATPSFLKCFISTVVLLLAKSSADQMLEKTRGL
jgi:hypothetical protein